MRQWEDKFLVYVLCVLTIICVQFFMKEEFRREGAWKRILKIWFLTLIQPLAAQVPEGTKPGRLGAAGRPKI